MIRRIFWALLGLGFGVVLGMRAVRQLDRVTESATPGALAERAGRRAGKTGSRWRDAIAAGAEHAQDREAAMRQRFGVPTIAELAGRDGTDGTDRP